MKFGHVWAVQGCQWRQRLCGPEEAQDGLITDCSVEGNVARFLTRVEDATRANLAVVKVSTGESRDNRKVRLVAFARCDIKAGCALTVVACTPQRNIAAS